MGPRRLPRPFSFVWRALRYLIAMPRWLVVVFLVVAISATWTLRTTAMGHFLASQKYEDVYYLPPPQWLTVMSLGHEEALADLIWMKALIYFGEEFQHEGAVRHVFKYGKSLLQLDPTFKRVYRWVGMAGMYTPAGSSATQIERAIAVLEEGANRFADDGQLAWDAGASIAYEWVPLLDDDDPRIPELKARAQDYMVTAARLGAGPDWLVLNNATQLKKLGEQDRALRHLEEMYAVVRDPKIKEQIGYRIAELKSEAHAQAFQSYNREFDERWRRDYPYVPASMYALIADPQ